MITSRLMMLLIQYPCMRSSRVTACDRGIRHRRPSPARPTMPSPRNTEARSARADIRVRRHLSHIMSSKSEKNTMINLKILLDKTCSQRAPFLSFCGRSFEKKAPVRRIRRAPMSSRPHPSTRTRAAEHNCIYIDASPQQMNFSNTHLASHPF